MTLPRNKIFLIAVFSAVILTVLGGVGIIMLMKRTSTPPPSISPSNDNKNTVAQEAANNHCKSTLTQEEANSELGEVVIDTPVTYQNYRLGFSMQFPKGWSIPKSGCNQDPHAYSCSDEYWNCSQSLEISNKFKSGNEFDKYLEEVRNAGNRPIEIVGLIVGARVFKYKLLGPEGSDWPIEYDVFFEKENVGFPVYTNSLEIDSLISTLRPLSPSTNRF